MSFRSLKGLCAWLMGLTLIGPLQSAPPAVAAARVPVHCPGSGLRPTLANLAEVEQATLCLIDIRRVSRGRGLLRHNVALAHVAVHKARLMVHKDFFADIGPAGMTPLSQVAVSSHPLPAAFFSIGYTPELGA